MGKAKTLVPNDLRDFLSILSFVGFVAIFLKFTLGKAFLSNNLDSLFLIIAGSGLLALGKVVQITKWARDGIQGSETTQLMAIIFGLTSIVIGVLMMLNFTIPANLTGFIGLLALVPAIFIFFDYITKNNGKCF